MEEPRVLYCILKTLKVLFQKQELMEVFLSLPPFGTFSPQEKWHFEIYSVDQRCSAGPRAALSSLTSVLESAFIPRQPFSSVSSLASFTVLPNCGVYSFPQWRFPR